MLRSKYATLLVSLIAFSWLCHCANVTAQEMPQEKQSVVAFDIDAAKVIKSAVAFGVDVNHFDEIPMEGVFEGFSIREISRVKGSLSLPKEVDDLMALGLGGELPMEFYVEFEFTNADACLMLTENIEAGSDEMDIAGTTYWTPNEESEGPKGVLGRRVSDTVFEFGTKTYLTSKNRKFGTGILNDVWSKIPPSAVRIAADLDTPQAFVDEAIAMASENAGAQEEAYMELIGKTKSFSIAADAESETLLSFIVVGKSDDDAEEIQSGLDSLVGLAQMGSKIGLGQLAKQMPKEVKVLKTLVDSMGTQRKGVTVRIDIDKPEGFADAATKLSAVAQTEAKKAEKRNLFRQLGLATLNYEAAYTKFPFAKNAEELGWRVRILPYMDEKIAFEKFDMDEGHASEENAKMIAKMPKSLGTDGKNSNVAWIQSDVTGFADITDGSSNTIMLIEYPAGEPWLENGGLSIDKAVELVKALKADDELVITFYDCSTVKITNKVEEETLRNLFDPKDGNVVDRSDF